MDKEITFTPEELKQWGATEAEAKQILDTISANIPDGPEVCWKALTEEALHPDLPAAVHQQVFQRIYQQDERYSDAPSAWWPDEQTVAHANISRLMKTLSLTTYSDLYHWSVTNRPGFWDMIVRTLCIPFETPYTQVVSFPTPQEKVSPEDNTLSSGEGRGEALKAMNRLPSEALAKAGGEANPHEAPLESPTWFPGATLNIASACFQADPSATAIIFDTGNGQLQKMSFGKLDALSNRVANGLKERGFRAGDAAAVDMLMTAEAVAIYLGIVKAGGAVVSIADSLAPAEVDKRLRISKAKWLFTQDGIQRGAKFLPLYDKLLEIDLPRTVVLPGSEAPLPSLRADDLSWDEFLPGNDRFDPVSVTPNHICNILFSSGTTGDPKAIPWTHTTPIKCAADGWLHHDIHEGDVVAWPTNIGWMMGPWLIFASLVNRATIALFYGAPTGQEFGRFVQDARVTMLGLVPSIVKRWIETDCMKGLDWSAIRCFSSTGESSNPQDYLWLMARAGYKPVIEYCGGTEIGGGYFTGTMVQPASPATFTTVALGLDVMVLGEGGKPSDKGELYIVPPSIGLSIALLNKDHHETYFADVPELPPDAETVMGLKLGEELQHLGCPPVLRRHGDEVEVLPNGYFRAHGRADDTMNLGGIKTSSVEIERLLDVLPGVKETAAIAVPPPGGGPSQLVVYCVLNEGARTEVAEMMQQFQAAIKQQLNPLFRVVDVVVADNLPRTASNKVMRRVLRDEYLNRREGK